MNLKEFQSLVKRLADSNESRFAHFQMALYKGFGQTHPQMKLLQRMQIFFGEFTFSDRKMRLEIASQLFERDLESFYDLTIAEVQAFVSIVFPRGGKIADDKVIRLIEDLMERYNEQYL